MKREDSTKSAARFFYCAKASKQERDQGFNEEIMKNIHPTVNLPPKALILDPFAGSGSTGIAAIQEGFIFIGIEKEEPYYKIANTRIKVHLKQRRLICHFITQA
jgi:site-specific DNA-methyltransferase (adenine-specific)